jgi:threonine aldolase
MMDFRSDTVTKPTPAMRGAMVEAEVGDDVFGEDPTAQRLEARVAELLGKEAGVFVPSGVMGNQLAIKVHTRPGDEVVVAERSHIYHYESGAPGVLSGVQLRPLEDPRGFLTGEAVAAAVRGRYDWEPRTRLVCLENTVNKAGGRVYPLDLIHDVAHAAREHDLALHLDGARLWNAAVASGLSEAEIAAPFDTVSVCLSKGLGAPVGSVLAGSEEAIRLARRYRKLFGGGMRQIGILAAAGLYALDHHRAGLADDHRRARRLATALAALPGFDVDPAAVETNIVLAETERPAAEVLESLAERGVRMVAFGPHTVRATLHRDLSDEDLDAALAVLAELFGDAE